jgi:hypothetical protein
VPRPVFFISPIGAKIEKLHLDSSTGYLEFVKDKAGECSPPVAAFRVEKCQIFWPLFKRILSPGGKSRKRPSGKVSYKEMEFSEDSSDEDDSLASKKTPKKRKKVSPSDSE